MRTNVAPSELTIMLFQGDPIEGDEAPENNYSKVEGRLRGKGSEFKRASSFNHTVEVWEENGNSARDMISSDEEKARKHKI